MLENNVLEADLCYAKALAFDPHHTEALVYVSTRFLSKYFLRYLLTPNLCTTITCISVFRRRKRTLPLVSAMDAKLLGRIQKKRDEFARLPHTSSLKRAMRESYFLHIYHTVAIEGNTLSLGQTRYLLLVIEALPIYIRISIDHTWIPTRIEIIFLGKRVDAVTLRGASVEPTCRGSQLLRDRIARHNCSRLIVIGCDSVVTRRAKDSEFSMQRLPALKFVNGSAPLTLTVFAGKERPLSEIMSVLELVQ